jgi:hypothetical protein
MMVVTKMEDMAGYHTPVWYSKHAITNILALSNVIKQYRVTYDSDEQMFAVHRESTNKPNMEFWMHESGLHYYDPHNNEFAFINTVSRNKEGFKKGRSRVQKSLELCTPCSVTRHGRISSG